MTVTNNTQARKLILDVYHDDPSPKSLPSGVHLVLINKAALSSLNFCERLQTLLNREDITLVPIFLDETLRMPASETDLLRQWYDQLIGTSVLVQKEKIDLMLSRFGPMIENLRNTLVPSIDRIVTE